MMHKESVLNAKRQWLIGGCVFFVSLLFYGKTLAPTVVWGDPAKLADLAHRLYLSPSPPYHVIHNVIGWLWGKLPFADYAYGQNLLSAVFASLALTAIYLFVLRITASQLAAVAGSSALMVSHTFWWLAVINESYAPLFFFLAACLLLVLLWADSRDDRLLYLFSFLFGLGIGNHALLQSFGPAFAVFFLVVDKRFLLKWRRVLLMVASFLVGYSLLLYLALDRLPYSGWQYVWGVLTVANSSGMTTSPILADKTYREMLVYPLYVAVQFPGLGFFLGFAGGWKLARKQWRILVLLASIFAIDMVLSSGYMWQRQPEMMVPSYIVFAICVGVGTQMLTDWLRSHLRGWRSGVVEGRRLYGTIMAGAAVLLLIVIPVGLYYSMPAVASRLPFTLLTARAVPYRDNARYFLLPDKSGYDGAARYGREALESLPPDAVLLADFTPGSVLLYLQEVEGLRQDVLVEMVEQLGSEGQLTLDAIRQYAGRRPIYLTDYRAYPQFFAISKLNETYDFVSEGHLFRLISK